MPVARILFISSLFFISACAKPQPYVASLAVLQKLQPDRETVPAPKGCSLCHKVIGENLTYKYYPVRLSHKSHTRLGITCTFCHRKASKSTATADYLMPEGHGFSVKTSERQLDTNPCKACHIYSSDFGKKDRRLPAGCNTCHPSYSADRPLAYKRWKYRNNLTNNHKRHFDIGIPCIRCHVGFDMMDDTTLTFTPKMDVCNECHGALGERRQIEADTSPLGLARAVFLQNCAMCHGVAGKGDGAVGAFFKAGLRPKDLTDPILMSRRTDRQIYDIIEKGGPEMGLSERMPAWEGLLTEDDTGALVKYIRYLSGTPTR